MNQELLASLRVLGHVARADARVRSEERLALEALAERDGGNVTQIVHDDTDLDTLLRTITSPELKRRTWIEAVALASVDGRCGPEELRVLERIRAGLHVAEAANLRADSAAFRRRNKRVREALENATAAYLRKVAASAGKELSMSEYERLVAELGRAKDQIEEAFRDVVDEVERETAQR